MLVGFCKGKVKVMLKLKRGKGSSVVIRDENSGREMVVGVQDIRKNSVSLFFDGEQSWNVVRTEVLLDPEKQAKYKEKQAQQQSATPAAL